MLDWEPPDKVYLAKYSDQEELLHTCLLHDAYSLYRYYDSPTKAEKIIREIVNDAKQVYLEEEEA